MSKLIRTLLVATILIVSNLMPGPALAQANTVITNEIVPFGIPIGVPCANNDGGFITGEVHNLFVVTQTNTGMTHVKWHFNLQNVSGVGDVSGELIRASAGQNVHFTFDGPTYEETFVHRQVWIITGSTGNLNTHITFHVTVNANGEVTSEIDQVNTHCQ